MKFRWTKRLFKETAGQEIAEAAVVLPVLFLLIFGILWFARAYSIYSTLERAANAAAIAGAQSNCATCAITSVNVQTTIVNPIVSAAHLDPTQVTFRISQNVNLNGTSPIATGTIVDLSYPFGFRLNGALTGFNIKAEARALQEN
jgi:Flp pilus assembly protein TadG